MTDSLMADKHLHPRYDNGNPYIVDLIISQLNESVQSQAFDPLHMRVISFHSSTGAKINSTVRAYNPTVLLPVGN